jgi:hypothetical protein
MYRNLTCVDAAAADERVRRDALAFKDRVFFETFTGSGCVVLFLGCDMATLVFEVVLCLLAFLDLAIQEAKTKATMAENGNSFERTNRHKVRAATLSYRYQHRIIHSLLLLSTINALTIHSNRM